MNGPGLTTRHREIITLIGREELTYSATARELGISAHTVRAHIRVICDRARKPWNINPRSFLKMLARSDAEAGVTSQ